jgi:sugar/nucleoside kinase (ribokinase family)
LAQGMPRTNDHHSTTNLRRLMSILVVGSVAFDTIATPSGRVSDILGGAATYFALAASYFSEVRVVAVVGDDFTSENEAVFKKRGIDTRGIQRSEGKTFRWGGQYLDNLNEAKTDFTELNVFEKFQPRIPKEYSDTQFLFLANIHPTLQTAVRLEMDDVRLTGGDTMNFWIKGTPKELAETLVNILLINDTETKMLANEKNLLRAATKVIAMGPSALVVKHGEYGSTIFFREGAFGGSHPFRAPALPIDEVKDPTGAGDSFAGGFMGYIASQGEINREVLKRALFYGGVMGSFAVERFGTERLQNLTREEIDARFQIFRELTHLD